MAALASSLVWRGALGVSLALGLLPLMAGINSVRIFAAERAGSSEAEQLAELRLPWTQPVFLDMVRRLDALLPPDAALVCTPAGGSDESGKARWFLFLADALYPRRVFVRQPRLASGTLASYPRWVAEHLEVLDTDGSGLSLGAALKREELEREVDAELEARGVEWELFYRLDSLEPFTHARLLHKGQPVALTPQTEAP